MITVANIANWIILVSYWILITIITIRIMIKRRTVSSSMAWLLIIYIIPIIGIMAYLSLGELKIGKLYYNHKKTILTYINQLMNHFTNCNNILANESSDVAHSLFQLCKNRQGIKSIKVNKIKLLNNQEETLKLLIEDIKNAKKNINMIFYIWQIGGLVDQVTSALIAAAKRGVCCRLILDSAGSIKFFHSTYPNKMKAAGINIVKALNINLLRIFFRRMDLRQHRKMILIDNQISYTGSMNMIDPQYFKKKLKIGKWVDIMVRMEGPITITMGVIFSCDWESETGEHIVQYTNNKNTMMLLKASGHQTVQIIPSGPECPEGMIHQVLLTSVYAAKKQLIITTPYLIPTDDLLRAICTAAQRGVEVHIIIPKQNDSILVFWASKAFFTELLDAGVLIHQFTNGLLHTKSILVDKQLSLIGTANLDIRSLWLNFELTLAIDNKEFSNNLAKIQDNYISNSQLIDPKTWSQRPYWQRIIENIFYFFTPLL